MKKETRENEESKVSVIQSHLGVSHESNAKAQLSLHASAVAAARLVAKLAQPVVVTTIQIHRQR